MTLPARIALPMIFILNPESRWKAAAVGP
jgi:hypothetical protein